uniref:Uncharacterized protein n=1 Tax=Bicosoecida sp. CB-2014 TaxID=1486930 RepID=A0A7S1G8M3_9STRA|mmetsp:Transcript_19371/g.68559  ORF Transcript_19371/g.68559 Transcript_19371/m.68559 type:complete len:310 (+) Transcript_19371:165-1094(+)
MATTAPPAPHGGTPGGVAGAPGAPVADELVTSAATSTTASGGAGFRPKAGVGAASELAAANLDRTCAERGCDRPCSVKEAGCCGRLCDACLQSHRERPSLCAFRAPAPAAAADLEAGARDAMILALAAAEAARATCGPPPRPLAPAAARVKRMSSPARRAHVLIRGAGGAGAVRSAVKAVKRRRRERDDDDDAGDVVVGVDAEARKPPSGRLAGGAGGDVGAAVVRTPAERHEEGRARAPKRLRDERSSLRRGGAAVGRGAAPHAGGAIGGLPPMPATAASCGRAVSPFTLGAVWSGLLGFFGFRSTKA